MSELRDSVQNLERRLSSRPLPPDAEPLEAVLKGKAIELWSDLLGERLWLAADEQDVLRLGEPRGAVYTAAEARLVCRITDKATVREVHRWKRNFNGVVLTGAIGGQDRLPPITSHCHTMCPPGPTPGGAGEGPGPDAG